MANRYITERITTEEYRRRVAAQRPAPAGWQYVDGRLVRLNPKGGPRVGKKRKAEHRPVGPAIKRMEFTLDRWPPPLRRYTTNRRGGGRVKTEEARDFEAYAVRTIQAQMMNMAMVKAKWYSVTYAFEGRWESKKGEPLVRDVSNLLKVTEDSLAKAIGVDDSRFKRQTLVKEHATGRDLVQITVEAL
jgi:Holliday junction resolvase RusA-like endonuclease